MSARAPLVSIGLPVFNGARYLRQAVESALNQTWTDFELVISDNASTDETPALLAEFAARDPRVMVLRQSTNRGVLTNSLEVLERSRGEYFAFLAHDDYWAPEFLRATMELLSDAPDLTSAFSQVQVVDEADRPKHLIDLGFLDCRPPRSRFDAALAYARFGKDYHSYAVHRRSHTLASVRHLRSQHPYFQSNSRYCGGVCTHALVLDGAFAIVPQPLFYYRAHADSFSRTKKPSPRELLFHLHYTLRCLAMYGKRAPSQFGSRRGTYICYKLAKVHWRALWRLAWATLPG
jgi:glycosyltransferase involved in cell wall biosynthesis